MTQAGSASYAFDGANRLKSFNGGASTYGYDGDGKRVRVTDGSASVFYLRSSIMSEVAMEINSQGVLRAYVYGGSNLLLAQQSTDGQFYWLHANHLGTARAMTDTTGNLVYKGQFDPFGHALMEWSSSGNTNLNTKKFTGYDRDAATGLDYANARMHNPTRGRFIQPDQLGLGAADFGRPQTLNRYAYVHNDPINFVDPSGLDEIHRVVPNTPGGFTVDILAKLFGQIVSGGGGVLGSEVNNLQLGRTNSMKEDLLEQQAQWNERNRHLIRRGIWLDFTCNRSIIDAMTEAWMRAGNGTLNTEAGFIAYIGADLRPGTANLPNTNEFGQISINLSEVLPQGATLVAVFHTHPSSRSSDPSTGDIRTARNLTNSQGHTVPVFVIHQNGTSVYDPELDKTYKLRENLDWQRECH